MIIYQATAEPLTSTLILYFQLNNLFGTITKFIGLNWSQIHIPRNFPSEWKELYSDIHMGEYKGCSNSELFSKYLFQWDFVQWKLILNNRLIDGIAAEFFLLSDEYWEKFPTIVIG